MNLLRPSFDAACASLVGTPAELTAVQCAALWRALVPANAKGKSGRQRWSAAALSLREPLRKEMNTVAKQIAAKRFDGEIVNVPGKPSFDLGQMHRFYAARLGDILLRLDAAMRSNGHYCTIDDEDYAQPLTVVIANERQAGRAAGNTDWTQWEDPATVRKLTNIFAAGPKVKHGAQWAPYMPNGTRKRGAAAEKKAIGLWRGAFHDAIASPLQSSSIDPLAGALARFYATLKEPAIQQHIEDAIRTQVAAHRSPLNPAFKRSLWHALDDAPRIELAAQFHAALIECQETALAMRQQARASEFDPAYVTNPWEIDDEAPTPAFMPRPAKYDEPASTFDTPSNGGALTDILDQWEAEQH